MRENPYPVNLVHVNADQVEHFAATNGVGYFQERYNIGHWVWELSRFPDAYQRSFDYFDEVWVPTAFAQDAVARNAPVPVVRIPYSLSPRAPTTLTRAHFGWTQDRFVFLFIFDFSSYLDRKNPLGLLRAFREAFTPSDDVLLVLKCVHPEMSPEGSRQVFEAAAMPNVTIMSDVLPRDEIDALVQLCDCYVSLHRSEGFGLTMGEAMSHGKPVIATGYSGNMDFMTAANSLIVRHRLIELAPRPRTVPARDGVGRSRPRARVRADALGVLASRAGGDDRGAGAGGRAGAAGAGDRGGAGEGEVAADRDAQRVGVRARATGW